MRTAKGFAHVLLFRCPRCYAPFASICSGFDGNLEPADAQVFHQRCDCGWNGDLAGFTAVRHWVAPWDIAVGIKIGLKSSHSRASKPNKAA